METRKYYLDFLKKHKNLEQIKVITGVRRSGKSFLLKTFQKYLHDLGITEQQITYLNFESFEFSSEIENQQRYSTSELTHFCYVHH